MPYSMEQMELSKEEEELISKLKADKINLQNFLKRQKKKQK